MKDNFYCQQKCGEVDFNIDEWNKSVKEIDAMPISEEEKQKLIWGEPCKEQCFTCMAIVGKRQLETNIEYKRSFMQNRNERRQNSIAPTKRRRNYGYLFIRN